VTHRGRQRRRVARAVVLYAMTVRTKATNTGCLTEAMPLAYTPPKPVRAVLMVMVHTAQGTTIRRMGLTIQPPRHHTRPAHGPRAMPRRITHARWRRTRWSE
jgi:hypothetical protein